MKMKNKWIPMLMAIMMAFVMMPMPGSQVYADDSDDLWVDGVKVTGENTEGTGWSYDDSSKTLTLTNAKITAGYDFITGYYAGIYYEGTNALNIVLEGSNSIALNGSDRYGIYSSGGNITISGDGSLSITVSNTAIEVCGTVSISGGFIEATGATAGLKTNMTGNDGDIEIKGGSVTASGVPAIDAGRNVIISSGKVTATATGDNGNAISASNYVDLMGGSVTASGAGTGHGIDAKGIDKIGNNVRIWAGDDENSANDVTDTFVNNHNQKWVQTETATLWVAGIPVTRRNAADILGDIDEGASASYDAGTKTLTLNNYSYASDGYNFDPDHKLYAAIYADQELTIRFEGDNTVKCKKQESSSGNGIHVAGDDGDLIITGNGMLTASAYGIGVGIYAGHGDIEFNGGTVNALGDTGIGISTDKENVLINSGIVTASGDDRGFSAANVIVADDMGINAGDSKESAIDTDKDTFKGVHRQKWVQVAKAYPLRVLGRRVMVTNMDDVLGDGTVNYDPDTNTLKLNGANITADKDHHYNNAAIHYENEGTDLIIDASKDSTVKGPDYDDPNEKSYGIFSKSPLIVKGKLTVIGNTGAIDAIVKNAVPGLGWTNTEGTEGKTEIKANEQGQKLGNDTKRVLFPAPRAAVTTAPAGKSLTYNGAAQELVKAGTASDGTMQYALGTDENTPPEEGWSTSIPKGTNAGDYFVWYRAEGDGTHLNSDAACLKVTIHKAKIPMDDQRSKPASTPARQPYYSVKDSEGNTVSSAVWKKGSGVPLTIIVKRDVNDDLTYGRFSCLMIDGHTVDGKQYDKASGSLILTLKPEYLETLEAGNHYTWIGFDDGSTALNITIAAAETNTEIAANPSRVNTPLADTPQARTGDSDHMAQWGSLLLLSVAAMIILLVARNRRRHMK